jgi:hypothetical protein
MDIPDDAMERYTITFTSGEDDGLTDTSGEDDAPDAAPVPVQPGPKKPVTTLVSMLPETTYREANDGTARTPQYVRVQRQLLQYLELHASETLTPRQALRWTAEIADDKEPPAKDALRLCYYMRSQGFDTYAAFQDDFMSLYIANQNTNTEVGESQSDLLYWKQNFKNNVMAVDVEAYLELTRARGERRNAYPPPEIPFRERRRPHRSAVQSTPQPAQGLLAARIAAATVELESLLLSNSHAPEYVLIPDLEACSNVKSRAIDAAIARIDELRSQGT